MHLASSIMFALSANIDTLLVAISYGIKKSHIPLLENIVISLITFVGTICAISMGMQATIFIPADIARLSGSGILISLGLYYAVKFCIETIQGRFKAERKKTEEREQKEKQKKITLKESVILACALSINNMGMGIGASIAGMNMIPTSISTLLFCILFLYAGNKIGSAGISDTMQKYAGPLSGLILIVLGLYEILI